MLQRHLDAARSRALPDHDVNIKVLHRGIEDLLNRGMKAMDFIDEKDVIFLQICQQCRQVAALLR